MDLAAQALSGFIGLIFGGGLVWGLWVRALQREASKSRASAAKYRNAVRMKRLQNWPDEQRDLDRKMRKLPPVTELKSYLWVGAFFDGELGELAFSEADVVRAIKRAKANTQDWNESDELPTGITW